MGAVESCCQGNPDDKMLVTKMDLSHCGCLEVPNIVFNAERCIENLILSSNQITSLPPQLFHCQELKHLNLIDNCLTSIPPAMGSLLHLVSLKLDKNNLRDLPENLKTCRKLKRLSLNNNQWKQMPNIVTQLISLEELYMNDCELSYLPASVGRFTKLKILELRNNSLCNLPLSMSRLVSLIRLDIGDNEFTEFPPCINNLKNLKELLLDNNDIEEITEIRNLVNLEHLDASYNHISSVSETVGFCTNINMLNLSFNYIEQLPNSVGNISELQTLHFEMNELSEVPKSIGQCSKLEDLNLCNNRLYNIPNTIGLLRNLRNLNVSRNIIEEFPTEIGSCSRLSIINASYNRLQALPAEIGYLNNLKVLDLVGNFLMHLPITIINLNGVRAIWLSANQNVPLIPFTEDINLASGERFLTNIALPQLGEIPLYNQQTSDKNVETNDKCPSWSKKIRFAEDEDILPGKLHRTPTPFPKELRAPNRKHHVRNEEQRASDNYVNVVDGKMMEPESVLHPPSVPITKNGLLNFTESCVTVIREANIRRSNKDTGMDTSIANNDVEEHVIDLEHDPVSDPTDDGNESVRQSTNDAIENTAIHIGGMTLGDDQVDYVDPEPGPPVAKDNENKSSNDESDYSVEHSALRRNSDNSQINFASSRNVGSSFQEHVIYSNLVNHNVTDSAQSNGIESDYCKMDAQAIREMYHNDVIYGNNGNPKGNDSRAASVNGYYEPAPDVRQNYLCNNVSSYGDNIFTPPPVDITNYGPYGRVTPNFENGNRHEYERPPSKQSMASLAERMRSQNIAPPCYEIAKMYSTKAALFEHCRPTN